MCGKREYVGFGVNGSPIYADLVEFPMPAIRFQEPTPEICALRKKEEDDWKKLSKDEIKRLYRYSFCQTFAEFKAPTGEWKLHLGVGFWASAIGVLLAYAVNIIHQDLPPTFLEDRRQAQLKRMIALEVNPARSAGITTFAICGFANPSALGILIGSLGAMAPKRRGLITSVAFRAFIVGSIVCFMSASFAGILIQSKEEEKTYEQILNALQRKNISIALFQRQE